MTIKFNNSLNDAFLPYYSDFDKAFTVELIAARRDEGFNLSKLDFSWELDSVDASRGELEIQLNFESANWITSEKTPD